MRIVEVSMEGRSYDGASLERALKSGELARSAVVLTGMVKASEKSGYICFTRAGCHDWVDMPISLIEHAEPRGHQRCRDHTHPVMEITLKQGKDPEAQILAALLMQESPAYGPTAYPSATTPPTTYPQQVPQMPGAPMGGSGASVAMPGRLETRRRNPAQPGQFSGSATPFSARLGGGFGGVGGLGGGLNAWGCWDSCCGSHCAAGHYEAGPVGWQWVCDWWVCDDPCERCIWPW